MPLYVERSSKGIQVDMDFLRKLVLYAGAGECTGFTQNDNKMTSLKRWRVFN